MILAIDVHYRETESKVVGLIFKDWTDEKATETVITFVAEVAEYEPGAFYKRELPCILALLALIDLKTLTYIVVDGYVFLNDEGKAGLGHHLFEALDGQLPIIGVAKTSFFQNDRFVRPVLRGESAKPLYVTSVGIELDEAAANIKKMAGEFRLPTLLKEMDTLTKC
jgi:deoxyribonuclease V